MPGVLDTVVGYTGGTTPDPTYDSIGDHTEALRVTFDPRLLPMEAILHSFWEQHTPMPLSFTGTQYRSAIFTHGQAQRHVVDHVKQTLADRYDDQLALTAVEPAGPFYRAEGYHQRFLNKQRSGVFPWGPTI